MGMETVDLPQRNSPPPQQRKEKNRKNKQTNKTQNNTKFKKNDMNLREVNLPVSQRLFGIQFYEHFT